MMFLAAAFIAVWLLVTVYILFMLTRQRHLETELRLLIESGTLPERDKIN